jgi:two-component system KDP operon response regulator KdpE
MTRVLLIDDNITVLQTLTAALKDEGYQVFTAKSGEAGLNIARKQFIDLVILDLIMPKMDGYETTQRLHELGIQSVLILGPRNDERSVVKCLEMGADDYLPKPVATPILLAKIRMLMRRNKQRTPAKPPTYDDGQLVIDLDSRRVELRGKSIKLTRTEFRLLAVLLRKAGRVVSHEELIQEIWGTEKETSLGSLKLYIHYLRQKIEDQPEKPHYLLAEWGIGYRLRKPKKEAVSQQEAKTKPAAIPMYQSLASA